MGWIFLLVILIYIWLIVRVENRPPPPLPKRFWEIEGFKTFSEYDQNRLDNLAKKFNAFKDAQGIYFKNFGNSVSINCHTFTATGYGWYENGDLKFCEHLDTGKQFYAIGPIFITRDEFLNYIESRTSK